jgi:hypothetical protein
LLFGCLTISVPMSAPGNVNCTFDEKGFPRNFFLCTDYPCALTAASPAYQHEFHIASTVLQHGRMNTLRRPSDSLCPRRDDVSKSHF